MNKIFRKTCIKVCIISLSFCFMLFGLLVTMHKTLAATSKVYYMTVSVGETYATAGVNYHCDVDGSYVMYGTSASTMKKAETKSTLWSAAQNPNDEQTGFAPRYVCKADLVDLLPDTTYQYYVVVGDEQSETRTFKTGKASGATSVLFLTDTQSADTAQFRKINPLVQAIEAKEKNLNMVLMTGDIVDRGGYSAQWNSFFEGLTALNKYQFATVPGNHEYYHDKDAAYINASYYNQFFHNPQNGLSDRQNSSYFFVYGETLYIMLDILPNTKYPYDLEAHKAWFKQVVTDHPTRWIVVGSHAGAITCGAYEHDAKVVWNNWHEVFEECQVDLAISGHEHIYIRRDLYYQGEKNPELGVTYLVGPAAGGKDYAVKYDYGYDVAKRGNYRGQVIKTQGSTMTVSLYDTNGDVWESFTLKAKRSAEPTDLTDEEILNSVEYEYDEQNERLNISWSTDIWALVKEVKCSGDSTWSQLIPSCSESFATHTINGVYKTYNYKYTLTFVKADGTEISTDLSVILNKDLLPSSITLNGNKKLNVDEQTQLTVILGPEGCNQEVTYESLNPEIATVDNNGLITAVSAGNARIKVTSVANPLVARYFSVTVVATTTPENIIVTGIPDVLELNGQYQLTVLASPNNASKDVEWSSSNRAVAQVSSGKLYIMGYGTATITATSKGDPNVSYSFQVTCNKPAQSIEITSTVTNVKVNDTIALTCKVNPDDANQEVVWNTSNQNIATVDENGVVKGISEGTVVITVSSKTNNEIKQEITITVEKVVTTTTVPPKKGCNCKKSLELVITLTSVLAMSLILLRKKH